MFLSLVPLHPMLYKCGLTMLVFRRGRVRAPSLRLRGRTDVQEPARGVHVRMPQGVHPQRPEGMRRYGTTSSQFILYFKPFHQLLSCRLLADVDECQRFRGQVCASNSECINTQGSYACNCNDGFRANDADKSCQGETPLYPSFITLISNFNFWIGRDRLST